MTDPRPAVYHAPGSPFRDEADEEADRYVQTKTTTLTPKQQEIHDLLRDGWTAEQKQMGPGSGWTGEYRAMLRNPEGEPSDAISTSMLRRLVRLDLAEFVIADGVKVWRAKCP